MARITIRIELSSTAPDIVARNIARRVFDNVNARLIEQSATATLLAVTAAVDDVPFTVTPR